MKPSIGSVVTYTRRAANERDIAEEYTGRITRVVGPTITIPTTPSILLVEQARMMVAGSRGVAVVALGDAGEPAAGLAIATHAAELNYEVWLAVDVHNTARSETVFMPKIKFDPHGRDNTWRWPDRV